MASAGSGLHPVAAPASADADDADVHTPRAMRQVRELGVEDALRAHHLAPGVDGAGWTKMMRGTHHVMRGTTLYVGEREIETTLLDTTGNNAKFLARVYQDVVSKGYVVALMYGGDAIYTSEEVPTRVHSCCVTSETLGARDCDCVEQLNGALQRIVDCSRGILFFLYGASHEGRGASYICKARDRMLVQHSQESINTYEIYKLLGLRVDHRDFKIVADVAYCLRLHHAKWVMLTNNPDKIAAFHANHLTVARTEKVDSRPTRFNIGYLRSKRKYGHTLDQATDDRSVYDSAGIQVVTPFEPYAVPGVPRYVHMASYYLPLGCVWGWMLLEEEAVAALEAAEVVVLSNEPLRGKRWVQIDTDTSPAPDAADFDAESDAAKAMTAEQLAKAKLDQHAGEVLDSAVYWWRANVYYDLVGSEEFMVLEYGDPGTNLSLGQPSPLVQQALTNARAVGSLSASKSHAKRSAEELVAAQQAAEAKAKTAASEFADGTTAAAATAESEAGEEELIEPTAEEMRLPFVQAAMAAQPVIRFHSESVFNRFPVVQQEEKDRYRRSIRRAVKAGWGLCTLFFHDGRGRGLGGNFVDAIEKGTVRDTRDFEAASLVLQRHLRGATKVKVMASRQHNSIRMALKQMGVTVTEWPYVGDPATDKGHSLLRSRVSDVASHLNQMLTEPVPPFPATAPTASEASRLSGAEACTLAGLPISGPAGFVPHATVDPRAASYVVTGVGSSEAHGRYLVSLLRRHVGAEAEFRSLTGFVEIGGQGIIAGAGPAGASSSTASAGASAAAEGRRPSVLVVISQGLSPNSKTALRHMHSFDRVVLITAVTDANKASKVATLNAVRGHSGGGVIVSFPLEDEYGILVRAVGPVCGFLCCYQAVLEWCKPASLPSPAVLSGALETASKARPPAAVLETLIASARCMSPTTVTEVASSALVAGTTPAPAASRAAAGRRSWSVASDDADSVAPPAGVMMGGFTSPASIASPTTDLGRGESPADGGMAGSAPASKTPAAAHAAAASASIPLRSHPVRNVALVAAPPLTDCLLNISKKFEEGMMLVTPSVDDFLSFPHGRHQLLLTSQRRRPQNADRGQADAVVIIFDSGSAADTRMASMANSMTSSELPTWRITSTLPVDLQIIEYEFIINSLMLQVAEDGGVDQRHWPGHDEESALYHVTV